MMRYYRFLSESSAINPAPTVTSARIAEALDIDATQVRKDSAAIGLKEMGRVDFGTHGLNIVAAFDNDKNKRASWFVTSIFQ
ncbi:MAG: winged-helix domain-containing protein [Desulfobacterales bacterium]|nr:winged-helix domain-containing protein [Desulfobacterales bacterium]